METVVIAFLKKQRYRKAKFLTMVRYNLFIYLFKSLFTVGIDDIQS